MNFRNDTIVSRYRGITNLTRKTSEGFSLIELLAALSIFSIMAASLFVVFDRANEVWKNGEYKSQQYQNARTVLGQMSRELSSAIISTGGPSSFSNSNKPAYFWSVNATSGTDYDRDEIYFIMSRANALYEVGYYIDDQGTSDASDDVLMRSYTSDSSTDFDISSVAEYGSNDQLAFKVTDLSISFLYKSGAATFTFADVWDSRMQYTNQSTTSTTTADDGRLPDFMEISIRVVDQGILEKFGSTPDQINRKEFKVAIPLNKRSYRNE